MRWYKKLLIIVAVIAGLTLFVFFGLRITTVKVEGTKIYSEQEIKQSVFARRFSDNALIFSIYRRMYGINKLPFVEDIEVSYEGMHTVKLHVYDKTISGCIRYMGQYVYFDKDGMVLKSTSKSVSDIPLFETKTMTTFTMYEKVQMENEELLSQILNLANLFSHYQIKWDKVEMNEKDEAVLYSGQVKVLLGKKDNYDEQVSALASILETAKKQGGSGEIDMRNYKVKDDIIFKKSEVSSK